MSIKRKPLMNRMDSEEDKDTGEIRPKNEDELAESAISIPPKNWWKMTLSKVSLEPMLFLKMVAEGNFKIVADTLEIDRVCRINLNYSEHDCLAMDDGNHTEMQNAVQRYQNIFDYRQSLLSSIIPIFMIMILGPLSDKYGRKPAMILVLLGFIGLSLVYILVHLNPSWPVETFYLASLCVNIGGSWVVFNMAVYSYIADITTVETRTKRMGIADAVWYSGSPIGVLLGGYIFKSLGYLAVYCVSCILWTFCLLYLVFFIKESRQTIETREGNIIFDENEGGCSLFRYIISPFRTVFRNRTDNGRVHILILLGLKLGVFLVQGHQLYLWARKVLQWDATQFSTWMSVDGASHQIGMVLWLWFGEHFRFHDCSIANGGIFSIFLWSITLIFINGPSRWWLTIVASSLGLIEGSIEPALRSMLTAVVGPGEEGRILSMLGILESAWLTVDQSLYTYLYNTFVNNFPQINFVVQAALALLLMVVVFILKRSFKRNSEIDEGTIATSIGHVHQL